MKYLLFLILFIFIGGSRGFGEINCVDNGYGYKDCDPTPQQERNTLILFGIGALISLIGIIYLSIHSKCCGLCEKKQVSRFEEWRK